jgi:hypothetical protein
MTDTAVAPETPDIAETVSFLRRFAELMANGYNGAYLRRAAYLLGRPDRAGKIGLG